MEPEQAVESDGITPGLSLPAAVAPRLDGELTGEWLEALEDVVRTEGGDAAAALVGRLVREAQRLQIPAGPAFTTDYVNTIPRQEERPYPGDEEIERRILRLVLWNSTVMVDRANKRADGIGGHLSTYASASSLYEVGFNHFFRGRDHPRGGDQIFFQPHASPGIYARAFLEGRLSADQLDKFRRQTGPGPGLPSYPHPRLMPDFWEFPTASMGLGVINAVYQARFNRYLEARGIKDTSGQRVWCFAGDGEMDEPESLGGLPLAGRELLDNLIVVVNCNLQRLDGPVRGNGKVIQELESVFRGCGWRVIKVIWDGNWDPLIESDAERVLVDAINEVPDGEFQKFEVESGAYIRHHLFGRNARLLRATEHLPDQEIESLRRGGHDLRKLYAAYDLATQPAGTPTVILAKTVKGWGLGPDFSARNATHQLKKMTLDQLRTFRDFLEVPISDRELNDHLPPYYHPGSESDEVRYLFERRRALGGAVPRRVVRPTPIGLPPRDLYADFLTGTTGKAEATTTAAFVRLLRGLLRDKEVGKRIVPIVPDEARTFGMEPLFRQVKIYSPAGQRYEPVDAATLIPYLEAVDGQILEEGITEAGCMASFAAAGTSHATHTEPMIPFFIFYSMFGFQRVGDLIWSFGDARGRGFLLGATAGRTTLSGEGLQHQDGHSLLLATSVPNLLAYDPAFAYEVAVIVREGLRRMYEEDQDIFYYLVLYNEKYEMPSMPEGVEEGILKGLYLFRPGASGSRTVNLLASGPMVVLAMEAQQLLADQYAVSADVWSATSYQQLRAEALACERWNRLHPGKPRRVPYVTHALGDPETPVVAVTDFVKAVPDQVARWIPGRFSSLGTDGYGLSDIRQALRIHFEVSVEHLVVAALSALNEAGRIESRVVRDAIRKSEIDPECRDPVTL